CGLPVTSLRPCGRLPASALAGLEARVGLADHEDLAAAADHLAVAVTGLRRLQGGQDFHDTPRRTTDREARAGRPRHENKPAILAMFPQPFQAVAQTGRVKGVAGYNSGIPTTPWSRHVPPCSRPD